MSFIDKFFESLSKIKFPREISLFKNELNIEKLVLGNEEYTVENGFINLGKGQKVKIFQLKEGFEFTLPDGTKIQRLPEDKKKNIEYLDKDEKVFTRSDIGAKQVPFLSIGQKHESLVKILKPFLEGYRYNMDLGCLLIASTIIKLEDNLDELKLIKTYYDKLHGFRKIGHMIYNFFRSGILEKEIISYLRKLCGSYKTNEEIRRNFLIYWYEIIEVGYPTAYFVKERDTQHGFDKEIAWRFSRGEKSIDIYSRNSERNKRTERWLQRLRKRGFINYTKFKPYKIGYSKAVKFKVSKK